MRKIFLTTLLIFYIIYLFADEKPAPQPVEMSDSTTIQRPKTCFTFALDTIVMPGIKIGFGSIKYDSTSTKEDFVTIHANSAVVLSTAGISGTVNTFSYPQRLGFYTSYSIGVDYCLFTNLSGLDPGGSPGNSETNQFLFPYLSFGVGYSFKAGQNSFFRISGDMGLKLVLASFTLSYVF